MFIGDVLVCDHKPNKCLLFITRFEMEAWPTRFFSDCKRFFFYFYFFPFCLLVCSKEECKMTRQHIYSNFCAFIYRFSVLNLFACQASTITSWKWSLPFFPDRCTNKRGFGKLKKCRRFRSIETWSAWSDYLRISILIITVFISKFLHQWSV